ncbi:MAG TPA: DUF4339 domain-containing protein [Candidatus Angelobacter sp.]|nr:DUF4339 domain-containing protein [Candidatus Angelobacter sp.]
MKYYIQLGRDEQGPYTLARLQREVAAGTISPSDLARCEDTTWVPVYQLLASGPDSVPAAVFPGGAQSYDVAADPVPPNLHWAIVMVLGMVTASVFTVVWAVVQAVWVRRIKPESRALPFLLLAIGAGVIGAVIDTRAREFATASALLSVATFVLVCFAEVAMGRDLQDYYNSTENIHLRLSGAMIFFFNVLYFQYHLSRIARWKKTGVLAS